MDSLRPFFAWLIEHTYIVAFVSTMIDATGLPFPGRIVLIAAGALAANGHVHAGIVIAVSALGAVITDHIWYFAGWFGANRLMALYCRFTQSSRRCVRRTTDYFKRYGAATIIIGRFVAGVRVFAWPLARASGVGYQRFLVYDVVGAVLWSSTWVLLGYVLGDHWEPALERFGGAAIAVPLALLAALGLAVFVRSRRRARYGAAIF